MKFRIYICLQSGFDISEKKVKHALKLKLEECKIRLLFKTAIIIRNINNSILFDTEMNNYMYNFSINTQNLF